MAIQWLDPGGEYYFSSGISAAGVWSQSVNASLVSNAPVGRLTQYAIQVPTSGQVDKVLSANYSSIVMGGAYYVQSGNTLFSSIIMNTIDVGTLQCDIRTDSSGHIQITRNGTVLGTSTNAFSVGQGWVYIEFQVAFATTATGSAQVWVNNVSWLSVSSVQTATTNAFTNRIRWGAGIINSLNCFWKDMYMLDTGTGANTSRLGDIQVPVLFANAAGPKQQWTLGAGSTQTVAVQDGINHTGTWPDGDTTYISDSVSGHISDFGHQSIGSGTIYAVTHVAYARSDAGAANYQLYTNSSATITTTSNVSAGASYNYSYNLTETDPATSAQWTATGLNAASFGVKIP